MEIINKITSLSIIYNEESYIEKLIQEVSLFADEIIIVDSFSTDKTVQIIQKYPHVRLIQRKFDNFTNQKNFAIEQAKNNWVTFFDADERISKTLSEEILSIVNSQNSCDAYWVYRKFYLEGKYIKYSAWQNDKVIRLFRKDKCRYKAEKYVHETLECNGKVCFMKNKLDHYSFSSWESYIAKLDHYSRLKAEELYRKGKKTNIFHFTIKPAFRFFHHYILKLGFLDGKEGIMIAKIYANYVFNRYKYLKEMNYRGKIK